MKYPRGRLFLKAYDYSLIGFTFCYKSHKIRVMHGALHVILSIGVVLVAFMRLFAIRLVDSNGSSNPLSPVHPKARACWIVQASLSRLSLFIDVVSGPNNARFTERTRRDRTSVARPANILIPRLFWSWTSEPFLDKRVINYII